MGTRLDKGKAKEYTVYNIANNLKICAFFVKVTCLWIQRHFYSISCWDFNILLMSSLPIFGSAGEEALQGHSKFFAILQQGANRDILTRVNPCWSTVKCLYCTVIHIWRIKLFYRFTACIYMLKTKWSFQKQYAYRNYLFYLLFLLQCVGAKMLLYGQAFREIRQPSIHSPLEY